MTLVALLEATERLGIRLEARGDRLHVEAPAGTVTPELRDALTRQKRVLLAQFAPPRGFITLKNGPTLPVDVIELALGLEKRGIPLDVDDAHQFVVPDHLALTDEDRAAIVRWKHHLGAAVEYRAPEIA
jgi:hypothetical protein